MLYYLDSSNVAVKDSEFRGAYDASVFSDVSYYTENEFEIALRDYNEIFEQRSRIQYYSQNVKDLNWFQTQTLEPYMDSIDSFASYTKYTLLCKVFIERTYQFSDLENYFVDQLFSYIKSKNIIEKDSIKLLAKYANNLKTEVDYFNTILSRYKYFHGGFDMFFNSKSNPKHVYKFILPVIAYNTQNEIDVFLINPYKHKNPNWFSLAAIYKIYKYFAGLNIAVMNLHFNWYNLDSFFTPPIRQTIPLTENVAKMVAIYGDVFPFPYPNIFDPTSNLRYKITPLRELVKNYK